MESPSLPRNGCDSAESGASQDLHETVVNPFEFPGFLADHALSPDTCTFKISTPSTNSAKKTPARFRWSIDQMANLQPAEIHPEEIHRQALYLSTVSVDQELEEKTQLEIEQFFSRGTIVPSPWTQSDNKEPTPMDPLEESPTVKPSTILGKKCEVACQTAISLPMGFDLQALLATHNTWVHPVTFGRPLTLQVASRCILPADFLHREESLCSDGSGLSLRRKLFVDNTEENSYNNSIQSVDMPGQTTHTPPRFQTNHSNLSPATPGTKECSSEHGMHNTEQFSSSPIQASYASLYVCTPDSPDMHAKTEDPSSLPSPIRMHDPSLQTEWTSSEAPQQTENWASPSSPHSQSPPRATLACPQMLKIISPIASVTLQKLISQHISSDAGDNEACNLKELSFSTINVHKCNEDTFSDSQKYVCAEFSLEGKGTANVQETEFSIEAQLTGELKLPEIMSSTYNIGTQSNASDLMSTTQFTCGEHFENELRFKNEVKSGSSNGTDGYGCNEGHCNDGSAALWSLSTRTRSCEDSLGVPMEVTRSDDWAPPQHVVKGPAFLHTQAESSCLPNEIDSGYSTYHMTEEEIKVKDVSTMDVDPSYVCATACSESCH